MTRALEVWWEGRVVGRLTQDRHGALAFVYSDDWLRDEDAPSISASLPKREEPYARRDCRPFFSGLLPEESQREAAARALGVSRANDFALLDGLGGDVAGALQLLPPGERPEEHGAFAAAARRGASSRCWTSCRCARCLREGTVCGSRSPVRRNCRSSSSRARSRCPSPGSRRRTFEARERFPGITENEAFVMRLAAAAGLDVARVEPRVVRNRQFLLVERYDRSPGTEGGVRRIHQEDFCQALAFPPERKYASEGGPTLRDCFALLREIAVRPAVDVLKLLDAVVFNLIAGNADAHGKNFSILHDETGPRLAPLYDLLATVAWPELSPGLAMKVGRRATLAEMDAAGWARFAADAGLGLPLVRRRVAEVSEGVMARAEQVAGALMQPGLDGEALSRLAEMTAGRAQRAARSGTSGGTPTVPP